MLKFEALKLLIKQAGEMISARLGRFQSEL